MTFDRKVHVVSHSHWDREWYFTTCDSLVLMDRAFTDVLDELERNERVNFCLDGQISIVEEYLELYPERQGQMERLVREKRLFTGPWYTQTDTKMVSLASIVSNLYYGIWKSDALFGDHMKSGYLPDTFGFSGQLPMVFRQFGMDNFVFWRGTDYEKQGIGPYFIWVGQDGSEVAALNLYNSYGMAKGLKATERFVENIYRPLMERYCEITDSKDILMTVGNDQYKIVKGLDREIAKIGPELVIDSYEGFAAAVRDGLRGRYQGELNEGRYSRVHKSAGSIRASLKKANYEGEMLLARETERLNAMAREEGMGVSLNLVQKAWKLLFEGQAHDSIVGCVSDDVALDILNRGKKVREIGKSVSNFIKKEFAAAVGLKDGEVLIFNTDPFPFEGYKEVEIVTHHERVRLDGVKSCSIIRSERHEGCPNALVETPEGNHYEKEEDYYIHRLLVKLSLPSFGYRVFRFHEDTEALRPVENTLRPEAEAQRPEAEAQRPEAEAQRPEAETQRPAAEAHRPVAEAHRLVEDEQKPVVEEGTRGPLSIEGGRYRILYEDVNGDGRVTLLDGESRIGDFLCLTDMGNDGDTYDFSPLPGEEEARIAMHGAKVTVLENVQMMEVDCAARIPWDLTDRSGREGAGEGGAAPRTCVCPARITISLRDDDRIYVSVSFDNQALSHRVRLRVRGKRGADRTIAAIPGGTAVRQVEKGAPADWAKRYVEYPVDIEMNTGFAAFHGDGEQLTVLNRGVREYQADGDCLYLTLFASCPELGKPDLLYRPGRASGDTTKKGHIRIQTPMAQELGEKEWEFAVCFMENDAAALYRALDLFESPSVFYQSQDINLFYERIDNKIQLQEDAIPSLGREKSYLEVDGGLHVSGIYNSLYDGALNVRAMAFEDRSKEGLALSRPLRIGDLLEEGDMKEMKAYRLYTLRDKAR